MTAKDSFTAEPTAFEDERKERRQRRVELGWDIASGAAYVFAIIWVIGVTVAATFWWMDRVG